MARMNSKLAGLILGLLLLGGCAEPSSEHDGQDPAALAKQAVERASARYAESRTVGHGWLQTRVRLDNAKQALQAGDYATARAEAERAAALADASLAQARAEQNAWRDRFPVPRSTPE